MRRRNFNIPTCQIKHLQAGNKRKFTRLLNPITLDDYLREIWGQKLVKKKKFMKEEIIIRNHVSQSAIETHEKVTKMVSHKIKNKKRQLEYPPEMYSKDRLLRMTHQDMKKNIEKEPITPMQNEMYQSIMRLIPDKLKNNPLTEKLALSLKTEVEEDFIETIKTLNGTMTLRQLGNGDEKDEDSEEEVEEEEHGEASRMTRKSRFFMSCTFTKSSCKDSFKAAIKSLQKNLYITLPLCRHVLALSQQVLGSMLLLDVFSLRGMGNNNFENFKGHIVKMCKTKEDEVLADWLHPITETLIEMKDEHMSMVKKQHSFFNSLGSLMSIKITDLIERSISAWVGLFDERNKSHLPVLKMEMIYDEEGRDIIFYPYYSDLQQLICSVVTCISDTLQQVPKLISWTGAFGGFLSTEVSSSVMKSATVYLEEALQRCFEEPQQRLESFKMEFSYLMNGEADKEIEEYLTQEKTFDECVKLYTKVKGFLDRLNSICSYELFDLLEIDYTDMKLGLVNCVSMQLKKILNKMNNDVRDFNLSLCEEYKKIKQAGLKVPSDMKELLSMQEFIKEVRTVTIKNLNDTAKIALEQIFFMHCNYMLNDEDLEVNTSVLLWPSSIPAVFDKNDDIMEASRQQFYQQLLEKKEMLPDELMILRKRIESFNYYGDLKRVSEYFKIVKSTMMRLSEYFKEKENINEQEVMFSMPMSEFMEIAELDNMAQPFYKLFKLLRRWLKDEKRWMDGEFGSLVTEELAEALEGYFVSFKGLNKVFLQNYEKWLADEEFKKAEKMKKTKRGRKKSSVDAEMLENIEEFSTPKPTVLPMILKVLNQITEFREHLELIEVICNPGLKGRHWQELSDIVGFDLTPDSGTTLRKMLKLQLQKFLPQFNVVASGASKEYMLERSLAKMKEEWEGLSFNLILYRDTDITIMASCEDIQTLLDDHIVKTLTIKSSVHVKFFEAELLAWEKKINNVQQIIDEALMVQSQWLYLEPIFYSEDIRQQIPEEARKFKYVNGVWKDLMTYVAKDPKVLVATEMPGMLETLQQSNLIFEEINQGINSYLEKKRLFFPRFFFLSNDEMLEILSETKDPLRVQPHLKKCFEGIEKLQFDNKLNIKSMFSSEGENVKLIREISTEEAKGAVERWLKEVQDIMILSIKNVVVNAYQAYKLQARNMWVKEWPGQVVLCVSQIYWTSEVHEVFNTQKSLFEYLTMLDNQLMLIIDLVRGSISKSLRISLESLVVLDVHARDVIEDMATKGVSNEHEFQWKAQLRYYYENTCVNVNMINATVPYSNEYLGNTPRLVITPLTDRCYRTLIGAFHMNLNGAPEGPAGTGKTETTKDLAKAVAVQCLVFNCSDGLDYISMGKFFKGLACAGAWSCFDEFNRIDAEVLSVIAQQILCIIRAVQTGQDTFLFEGTELRLNSMCYICITMNPGYAGRSELPDNLKVLFRPVAMMVPDYAMIAEISLYSYGFKQARSLSVKIVTLYRLCSEQLSSQYHYDYGMRAVKTVLLAAGNIKLKYPDHDEMHLMLRSIIDVNCPKFLQHDIVLFQGIMSDIFPGVILQQPTHEVFQPQVQQVCNDFNIQCTPTFFEKVFQTHEMMVLRHGFMLVGDPFSGKTCILKVLSESMTRLHEKGDEDYLSVEYSVINPKSITMNQLYGSFDLVSHEWSDGVIATVFRNYKTSEKVGRKWIVFDGPVDAVWIENMNTVLDDNKKLCLTSGEIIQMSSSMNVIFETFDLSQASPATISRCGMIYMEASILGWRPLFKSWLSQQPALLSIDHVAIVTSLFEWLVDPCLDFIRARCKNYIKVGDSNQVMSMCKLLSMQLSATYNDEEAFENKFKFWLIGAVMFALPWSIGGLLDQDGRELFDAFMRELIAGKNENYPLPDTIEKLSNPFPDVLLSYDYFFEQKGKGAWRKWNSLFEASTRSLQNIDLNSFIVPTVDTVRTSFFLDLCINNKVPLILVGTTGTGKSAYVSQKLSRDLSSDSYLPIIINFSAQTTANQLQNLIMSKLQRIKKGYYTPQPPKTAIIFIDDLNMPALEVYGAQPPIELIRQFLDTGHWYDLKDTSKLYLSGLVFLGALGPPGGGRNITNIRLTRHFVNMAITPFNQETLFRIFSSILNAFIRNHSFPIEFYSLCQQTVSATLELYQEAKNSLLPTPAKSHYVFNLRDISRVINGICLIRPPQVSSQRVFIRLWVHEVLRVFSDKLISHEDSLWLFQVLKSKLKDKFNEDADSLFSHLKSQTELQAEDLSSFIFGDFMNLQADQDEKFYEEVQEIDSLYSVADEAMIEYNSMNKNKLNLIMFRYSLMHLSRICRLLKMHNGNMLLVGMGGSGKQSLCVLASFLCNCSLVRPKISSRYGLSEWREDIKSIMKSAGGHGKRIVFLVSDSQLKKETFVEDLDGILNAGEVANIFEADEKAEMMELVQGAAQKSTKGDLEPLALYAFFVNRCKQNIRILMTVSPIGNTFRERLRQYPSLTNCCTIDWFHNWPEEALEKVADKWLQDMDHLNNIVYLCKHFHVSAQKLSNLMLEQKGRRTYVTPSSYLTLLQTFKSSLSQKQDQLHASKKRYLTGINKIEFAASQVSVMQEELESLKPALKKAAEESERMVKMIEAESVDIEEKGNKVKVEEEIANKQAEESTELKLECERDLADAIPALEAAQAALDTLKPADISIVKSMKNPPKGVKLVMSAVCVMKNIPPDRINDPSGSGKKILDYWGPSKKLLGDINFLKDLKEYDKDNIPAHIISKLQIEFLPNPEFDPAKVSKASSAAEGLCKWILAMEMYHRVAKVVAPKKEKLAIAMEKLAHTKIKLREKTTELKLLNDKLAVLKADLEVSMEKKMSLESQFNICEVKLERATTLIGGLGGERERWTEAARQLQVAIDNLLGDILLSVGVVSYLGPFTPDLRTSCIHHWVQQVKTRKLPFNAGDNFNVSRVMGDAVQIQGWNIAGLPRDQFSIDNAVMVFASNKWPLMIDPQGQANKWVKNMEKENQLTVIKPIGDVAKTLEICVTFGRPLLLENVSEHLDPSYDPILLKNTYTQAGLMMIQLGEAHVAYNESFRFYMTTKFHNPHYLPEVSINVNIINFVITPDGLQDQLLGIVVAKERPELEEERQTLIMMSANNKRKLKEIEDTILLTLSVSEGNILEDEEANKVLESSKLMSDEIAKKQQVAETTEAKINEARKEYKTIAQYSSLLFFVVSDVCNIDPMYQYSLAWFINLYLVSIQDSMKSKILDRRLRNLSNHFTYNLFCNVCRSLFEQHKLVFSLYLTAKIEMSKGELSVEEFNFLLSGAMGFQSESKKPASMEWLSDKAWNEVSKLTQIHRNYSSLRKHMEDNAREWQEVFGGRDLQLTSIPAFNGASLSEFQRLMVVRCIRPEKVLAGVLNYVTDKMGKNFMEPPPFDLRKSFADSLCTTPLIFILSPGADPTMALLQFATDRGITGEKMQSISMGQGQGVIAQKMISEAMLNGSWVLLQNCHFATSWMSVLEKICEEATINNTHSDFRLWLTSYPSNKFPVSILQNSVKMTNEPPTGLKQNLLQSFLNDPINNPAFFEACGDKNKTFHKLLFSLCFFHALVQERRKFGALGWNISYEFNESDFRISASQLQMFINESEQVSYEAISYVTGECNYGGRVTDNWDRRCLTTILSDFYNSSVAEDSKYVFSPSGIYFLPAITGKDDYKLCIEFIKELPNTQEPEVFGLHDNVDISKQMMVNKRMFDALQTTFGGAEKGHSSKMDESLLNICVDVLEKLPPSFDLEKVRKKYPVVYNESMNTVLVQEMDRFNRLTTVIRSKLEQLIKAVKGLEVMSAELEGIGSSLLSGKIPTLWTKYSYPSLKPLGAYVNDLLERISFFMKWGDKGQPDTFWISGFFFTQAFLTAVMQNYARKFSIPIDKLVFQFTVLKIKKIARLSEGAIVYGLFIDGAAWNEEGYLREQSMNQLHDELPPMLLLPTLKEELQEEGRYLCPLYKTSERKGTLSTTGHSTNYVLAVLLPTLEPPSHWIKRGVALLCQLDD